MRFVVDGQRAVQGGAELQVRRSEGPTPTKSRSSGARPPPTPRRDGTTRTACIYERGMPVRAPPVAALLLYAQPLRNHR